MAKKSHVRYLLWNGRERFTVRDSSTCIPVSGGDIGAIFIFAQAARSMFANYYRTAAAGKIVKTDRSIANREAFGYNNEN
jgi:hypothetical protein